MRDSKAALALKTQLSSIDGSQRAVGRQLSKKLRSFRDRLGCLSFLSALASIWRMRSRVTENCWPTSSCRPTFGACTLTGLSLLRRRAPDKHGRGVDYSIALVERLSAFFITLIGFEWVRPRLTP